ncbi:MAG: type II secretion system major pseudopilin GspG [Caulobacteraceae bacterium]
MISIFVGLCLAALTAITAYFAAERRGRNTTGWTVAAFLLWPLLFVLVCLRKVGARKEKKNFVLPLEIITVIILVLVFFSVVGTYFAAFAPQVQKNLDTALTQSTKVQILSAENALGVFRADVGRYPTQAEGLAALTVAPPSAAGWNGPYLTKPMPPDAWGHPYHYENPGKHGAVDIFTLGSDNAEGGTGAAADVGNW